jgi:hypothetical protein
MTGLGHFESQIERFLDAHLLVSVLLQELTFWPSASKAAREARQPFHAAPTMFIRPGRHPSSLEPPINAPHREARRLCRRAARSAALADSFLDFFGNVLPLPPGPQRTRRGRGLQAVGQAPCPSHAGGAQARSAARVPGLSSL